MFECVCVCVLVCVCIFVCVWVEMCIWSCLFVQICLFALVSVCLHACEDECGCVVRVCVFLAS